jgi:hypothetical protein
MRGAALIAILVAHLLSSCGLPFLNYMPTTFLTVFTVLAYAAPVAFQGAILGRFCDMMECRNALLDASVGWCLYKTVII